MSASNPPDAVVDQPGRFVGHADGDPIVHEGHQAGRPVAPTDQVPAFHGKVLPAGSAPKESTFTPTGEGNFPSQTANPDMDPETQTSAMDTIGGATSADVSKGIGQPLQGQTKSEIRHDGHPGRSKVGRGLIGVPGTSVTATNRAADPAVDERQRALNKDEATPGRGDKGAVGAEDVPSASA